MLEQNTKTQGKGVEGERNSSPGLSIMLENKGERGYINLSIIYYILVVT